MYSFPLTPGPTGKPFLPQGKSFARQSNFQNPALFFC